MARPPYLKKGGEHLLQERWQIFQFMKEQRTMFAIEKMCRVFKISRSGFYHWLTRKPSARKISNQEALSSIKEIHQKSKGRYGSPKITIELQKRGIQISRPRVARLMRKANIRSVVHKKFRSVRRSGSNNRF